MTRYYKKGNSVESYDFDIDLTDNLEYLEISKEEYEDFIDRLPEIVPEPVIDHKKIIKNFSTMDEKIDYLVEVLF